jgi:pyroglutamyl-peptidase
LVVKVTNGFPRQVISRTVPRKFGNNLSKISPLRAGADMIRLLVTGFGSFPGVENNPSAALMAALQARGPHFARLGIHVDTRVLPVVYEGLGVRLAELVKDVKPQAILHFGVASRRQVIAVETRAHNRASLHAADANGARPTSLVLDEQASETISVRIPAAQIAAKIRVAGLTAEISRDAGTYLCNAVLFETLTAQKNLPVGFIHVPIPRPPRSRSLKPSFADIVEAADIAIVAVASHVRHISVPPAALSSS